MQKKNFIPCSFEHINAIKSFSTNKHLLKEMIVWPLLLFILTTSNACVITGCKNISAIPCICIQCQPGYTKDPASSYCCLDDYLSNCSRCNLNNTCSQCFPLEYGVNSAQKCQLCSNFIPGCRRCQSLIAGCTSCLAGFVANSSNTKQCVTCDTYMPYCQNCYSRTICSNCNDTSYFLYSLSYPDACKPCNQYLPHCIRCYHASSCYACINNTYVLFYNRTTYIMGCFRCSYFIKGCETCTSSYICINCTQKYQYLKPINNLCVNCNTTLSHCQECIQSNSCLRCQDIFYVLTPFAANKTNNICKKCDQVFVGCLQCQQNIGCLNCSLGRLVNKGCTQVIGCYEVNPLLDISSNCLKCLDNYFLSYAVDGLCICKEGWVIGQYCTTTVGCIALALNQNIITCTRCDSSQNFVLFNYTCVCKKRYYLSGIVCTQICGDGFLFNLQCDDGNNINGDGCSSKCLIEPHFSCINDRRRFPVSKCRFKGLVEAFLQGLYRIPGTNSLKIQFKLYQYDPIFTKMNLTKVVTFSLNNTKLKQSVIENGILTLLVDYQDDIDGKKAYLKLQYDDQYVRSPIFQTSFSMVDSTGLSLSIKLSKNAQLIKTMLNIIGYCSFACLILGSMIYKLMGVETIQTIQCVLIYLATSKEFQIYYQSFQYLNLALGVLPSSYELNRGMSDQFYTNLGYDISYEYNFSSIAYLSLFIIMLYASSRLVLAFINLKINNQEKEIRQCQILQVKISYQILLNSLQQKRVKCLTILDVLQRVFVFPITIGFSYHFFYSLAAFIKYGQALDSKYLIMLAVLSIYFALSILVNKQLSPLLTKITYSDSYLKTQRQIYPAIYLLRASFSLMVPFVTAHTNFTYIYEMLASFGLVYLIIMAVYRPYHSSFDNFAICMNEFTLICAASWIFMKDFAFYTKNIEQMIEMAMIGLLFWTLLLSAMRIVFGLKEKFCRKEVKNEKNKQSYFEREDLDYFYEKKKTTFISQQERKIRNSNNQRNKTQNYAFRNFYMRQSNVNLQRQRIFQKRILNKQLLKRDPIDIT